MTNVVDDIELCTRLLNAIARCSEWQQEDQYFEYQSTILPILAVLTKNLQSNWVKLCDTRALRE